MSEPGNGAGNGADLLEDARRVLTTWTAPSPEQDALRQAYVDHLDAHPDGLYKPCLPDHLTAGVLVLDRARERVLLNHHRKAGIWVAFGGHLEPEDSSLAGAAMREATEESGIRGLRMLDEPTQLDVHTVAFCSPTGPVRHLDVRYVALAPAGAEPEVSEESLDVRWFPVGDVPTEEPSMLALIAAVATSPRPR